MWKDVVKAKKFRTGPSCLYNSTMLITISRCLFVKSSKAIKGATKIMKEKYDDFNDKTKDTKYNDEYRFYMRLIRNGMPIERAARQIHESKIQYDDKGNFTVKE